MTKLRLRGQGHRQAKAPGTRRRGGYPRPRGGRSAPRRPPPPLVAPRRPTRERLPPAPAAALGGAPGRRQPPASSSLRAAERAANRRSGPVCATANGRCAFRAAVRAPQSGGGPSGERGCQTRREAPFGAGTGRQTPRGEIGASCFTLACGPWWGVRRKPAAVVRFREVAGGRGGREGGRQALGTESSEARRGGGQAHAAGGGARLPGLMLRKGEIARRRSEQRSRHCSPRFHMGEAKSLGARSGLHLPPGPSRRAPPISPWSPSLSRSLRRLLYSPVAGWACCEQRRVGFSAKCPSLPLAPALQSQ